MSSIVTLTEVLMAEGGWRNAHNGDETSLRRRRTEAPGRCELNRTDNMYALPLRALAALMLVVPSLAFAQEPERDQDSINRPIRGAAGASFSYGRPVGDFLRYVNEG